MTPIPFAINGLGRIGRALLRIALDRPALAPVAINELASADQLAHLIVHDTVHRKLDTSVEVVAETLRINQHQIKVSHSSNAGKIPWETSSARVVVDATGKCLTRECAASHLRGDVQKVIVSANAAGMDLTICRGANDSAYDPASHHLLSAASCTTNCLAPIAFLLHREFGLESAAFNTVHSYNNDQRLLEYAHPDPRRARAAALNMIPTTTSAVEALGRVLPELAGRISGLAIRVPTPNVSLIDLIARFERPASVESIKQLFRNAAKNELADVLTVTDDQLVSSDFLGDSHSAIVDLPLTQQAGPGLFRIVAWYDNEWGHASRLADLIERVGGER